MWTNTTLFIKLPNVNNRPMGENSPNLVTLLKTAPPAQQGSEAGSSKQLCSGTCKARTKLAPLRKM
jgi:hypothetical protein